MMRSRGFGDVELSGRLGHANVNVTNAVYLHEMKEKKQVAANIMEDFYNQEPCKVHKRKLS
jgi:integrase